MIYAPRIFKCGVGTGSIVEHNGVKFTVERWNAENKYTIIFVCENPHIPEFYKNPIDVKKLIVSNELKIIKL